MQPLKTDSVINAGHEITVNYFDSYVTAKCYNKESRSLKPVFYFRFKNESEFLKYSIDFFNRVNERKKSEQERKNKISEARNNFENPYKVGMILYSSWGYEQTNINFYQIIEVKNKTIFFKEISGVEVPSKGYASMAGMIKPVKDSFLKDAEVIKKIVQVKLWSNEVNYVIPAKHGVIKEYTSGDSGVYYSSYY